MRCYLHTVGSTVILSESGAACKSGIQDEGGNVKRRSEQDVYVKIWFALILINAAV